MRILDSKTVLYVDRVGGGYAEDAVNYSEFLNHKMETDMRQPHVLELGIADVSPDGDGDWTVTLTNGAWLTVCQEDLPRPPEPGDSVRVQLPIVLGFSDV